MYLKYLTLINQFNFGTNLDLTDGKYFLKLFLALISKLAYLKYQLGQFLSIFSFGTNLGLTDSKCLIKIIFDIKIKIGALEILDVLKFNKI